MSCNQSNAGAANLSPITSELGWIDNGGAVDRILFVSNAPEGVEASDDNLPLNLY